MIKEIIWKPIEGYEGLYEISNTGRVKSHQGRKKILNISLKKDGYVQVQLYKEKKYKQFLVHRLVALAFIDNPDNKYEINHIDGVRDNNNVDNLEWCTSRENTIDAINRGSHPISAGNNFGGKEIATFYLGVPVCKYKSIKKASESTGVHRRTITDICKGRKESYNGYVFVYV